MRSRALGRDFAERNPEFFAAEIEKGGRLGHRGDPLHSGTTGHPRRSPRRTRR